MSIKARVKTSITSQCWVRAFLLVHSCSGVTSCLVAHPGTRKSVKTAMQIGWGHWMQERCALPGTPQPTTSNVQGSEDKKKPTVHYTLLFRPALQSSRFLCCRNRRKCSPLGSCWSVDAALNFTLMTMGNNPVNMHGPYIWVNAVLFLLGLAVFTETTSTFYAGCLHCKLIWLLMVKKLSESLYCVVYFIIFTFSIPMWNDDHAMQWIHNSPFPVPLSSLTIFGLWHLYLHFLRCVWF